MFYFYSRLLTLSAYIAQCHNALFCCCEVCNVILHNLLFCSSVFLLSQPTSFLEPKLTLPPLPPPSSLSRAGEVWIWGIGRNGRFEDKRSQIDLKRPFSLTKWHVVSLAICFNDHFLCSCAWFGFLIHINVLFVYIMCGVGYTHRFEVQLKLYTPLFAHKVVFI